MAAAMTEPLRIWIRASHHPAFRVGGWAWVRAAGAETSGQAGGARNVTAGRTSLAGLAAALKDLPAGPVALDLADPTLARAVRTIAAGQPFAEDQAPSEDLDLWAQLATALKDRAVTLGTSQPSAGSPAAFAQAWADLARDKAKAAGPFAAAIPKPNLAKLKLG